MEYFEQIIRIIENKKTRFYMHTQIQFENNRKKNLVTKIWLRNLEYKNLSKVHIHNSQMNVIK